MELTEVTQFGAVAGFPLLAAAVLAYQRVMDGEH